MYVQGSRGVISTIAVVGITLSLGACGGGGGKSSAAKTAAMCTDYRQVVSLDSGNAAGSIAFYTQMRDLYRKLEGEAPGSVKSDLKVLEADEQALANNGTDSSQQNDAAQTAASHVDSTLGPVCAGAGVSALPPTTADASATSTSVPCVTDDTGSCATSDTTSGGQDTTGDTSTCVTDLTGSCTTDTTIGSQDTTAGSSSGNAMDDWAKSSVSALGSSGATNAQAINTVEKDISTIGKDYSANADSTTLDADCSQLTQDILGWPSDSPDATVNQNLKKAFDYLNSGSTDCGVDDQAASTELNKAVDYINAATSRIKSLG